MDIQKIKQKLAELESQRKPSENSNKNSLLWKPSPGKQVIRILPYKYNPDWPFLELLFHYEVSGRSLISPTSIDPSAPDPIIEFAEQLRKTSDSDDWRIARKISPKQRIYAPIVVRGKESEGVKYWGFAQMVYTELLKHIDDPDYGDITNPKTGRDITVEFVAPTDKNKYGDVLIRVKPNTSPLLEASAAATPEGKALLESIRNMPSVEEVFSVPTYEELKALLDKYVNASSETEQESDTKESKSPVSEEKSDLPFDNGILTKSEAAAKKGAAKGTKQEIASAFDDLFSN